MHGERRVQSYLADLIFSHNLAPFRNIENQYPLSDREREEKPAAFADFALQPNFPSMHLDELLRQGKAQAGSLRLATAARINLLELKEDPFMLSGGDSRPGIAYLDAHSSILNIRSHPNLSSLRRELYSVSHQIQKNLLDSRTVHGKWGQTFVALDPKIDGFLRCQRPRRMLNRFEDILQ